MKIKKMSYSKEVRRTMKGLPARRPRRIRRETIEDLKTFGILAGYTLVFMVACLIYIII